MNIFKSGIRLAKQQTSSLYIYKQNLISLNTNTSWQNKIYLINNLICTPNILSLLYLVHWKQNP